MPPAVRPGPVPIFTGNPPKLMDFDEEDCRLTTQECAGQQITMRQWDDERTVDKRWDPPLSVQMDQGMPQVCAEIILHKGRTEDYQLLLETIVPADLKVLIDLLDTWPNVDVAQWEDRFAYIGGLRTTQKAVESLRLHLVFWYQLLKAYDPPCMSVGCPGRARLPAACCALCDQHMSGAHSTKRFTNCALCHSVLDGEMDHRNGLHNTRPMVGACVLCEQESMRLYARDAECEMRAIIAGCVKELQGLVRTRLHQGFHESVRAASQSVALETKEETLTFTFADRKYVWDTRLIKRLKPADTVQKPRKRLRKSLNDPPVGDDE